MSMKLVSLHFCVYNSGKRNSEGSQFGKEEACSNGACKRRKQGRF